MAAKWNYTDQHTPTQSSVAVLRLDVTWTLPRVSLMCCGSAGWRGMARMPSALSNQPSMEPMFSCSSAAAVRPSADLQGRRRVAYRGEGGETCSGDRYGAKSNPKLHRAHFISRNWFIWGSVIWLHSLSWKCNLVRELCPLISISLNQRLRLYCRIYLWFQWGLLT